MPKQKFLYLKTGVSLGGLQEEAINQRQTFGHWEGDLVIFSQQKANLITLRERKSRYMLAIKNENRNAKSTIQTLVNYMKAKLATKVIDSLTLDNDISFIKHKEMAKSLEATIYFCEPRTYALTTEQDFA